MHPLDALPTGTVTFLFTDIEGSTRLAERLGTAAWSELLEAHQAILREAFTASSGREIKTEGDSCFVVFRSAQAGGGSYPMGTTSAGMSPAPPAPPRPATAVRCSSPRRRAPSSTGRCRPGWS